MGTRYEGSATPRGGVCWGGAACPSSCTGRAARCPRSRSSTCAAKADGDSSRQGPALQVAADQQATCCSTDATLPTWAASRARADVPRSCPYTSNSWGADRAGGTGAGRLPSCHEAAFSPGTPGTERLTQELGGDRFPLHDCSVWTPTWSPVGVASATRTRGLRRLTHGRPGGYGSGRYPGVTLDCRGGRRHRAVPPRLPQRQCTLALLTQVAGRAGWPTARGVADLNPRYPVLDGACPVRRRSSTA